MQNVLVTGANRGIGLGFVEYYLAQGARVFAGCRVPQTAQQLNALHERYREQLIIVPLDVTDEESIGAAHEMVRQYSDSLDLLINNAGVFHASSSLKEVTADGLRESLAVNTIAPLLVAKQFAALLQAGQSPKLVNITMPTMPISKSTRTENHAYVASRYALNVLTKMLALELGKQGIITVALYPGYLRTDMNQYAEAAQPVAESLPLAASVIDSLTMEQNGLCLLPNGNVYDW